MAPPSISASLRHSCTPPQWLLHAAHAVGVESAHVGICDNADCLSLVAPLCAQEELSGMAGRIKRMRRELFQALQDVGAPGSWRPVTEAIGMFAMLGLSKVGRRASPTLLHLASGLLGHAACPSAADYSAPPWWLARACSAACLVFSLLGKQLHGACNGKPPPDPSIEPGNALESQGRLWRARERFASAHGPVLRMRRPRCRC
jgi:hypothetical protein